MTRCFSHPEGAGRAWRAALVIVALAVASAPAGAAAQKRQAKPAARVVHAKHTLPPPADDGELSLSDEFDRAELIERMLGECRGIAYNAYELAQNSGEALRLPAPIQLVTVRVRHPYCAELLRTYAPKQRV